MPKLVIAGGGTGGHVYPGIAVAEETRRRHPKWDVVFIGTLKGLESRILPETGFRLRLIEVSGLPRRPGIGFITAGLQFVRAVVEAGRLLAEELPDVVLGTGGYVSAPVVVAAWMRKIPVILQEQNSIPGRANRWLSGLSREVHINFSESRQYFRKRSHLKLTGNPIRPEVMQGDGRATAEKYGLDRSLFTVFVFGGSRGASSLNQAIVEAWPLLRDQDELQVIVQTGPEDFEMVRQKVQGPRVLVRDYLSHINEAYSMADLVVSRAGAMTLAEISACGLPSILVPYPHAMNDHQMVNARNLVERGAATLLPDEQLSGARLAKEILALRGDRPRLKSLGMHARKFARPDAAAKIVASIEKILAPPPESGEQDFEDED